MMNPSSIDGWLSLCRQHEIAARATADNKEAAAQGFFHAGLAVECALKAYIWHLERFNAWPDKDQRPDLHTHNLRVLKDIAGIKITVTDSNAPCWHVVLQWDRNQAYDPKPMPRKVARAMVEAAFGDEGIVTWLRQTLKTNI
ncbi:hypothetical protein ACQZ6F_17425 [Rhizobium sp. A22-96]